MTTNHPANGPISLERLHQISKILSKAAAQSDGGNIGYAMADAVKVIDVAIAEFDAEPVTLIKPVSDLYSITSPTGSETTFTFDAGEASSFAKGGWTVQEYVELERYQQAMAGNYPVTPNGWIPVSERMPPQGVPLLVCSGNGVVQRTVYGFDGENWLDWYEQYDPVKAELDDLWQPLPAAPKL